MPLKNTGHKKIEKYVLKKQIKNLSENLRWVAIAAVTICRSRNKSLLSEWQTLRQNAQHHI